MSIPTNHPSPLIHHFNAQKWPLFFAELPSKKLPLARSSGTWIYYQFIFMIWLHTVAGKVRISIFYKGQELTVWKLLVIAQKHLHDSAEDFFKQCEHLLCCDIKWSEDTLQYNIDCLLVLSAVPFALLDSAALLCRESCGGGGQIVFLNLTTIIYVNGGAVDNTCRHR
jgi:hypothetical protein